MEWLGELFWGQSVGQSIFLVSIVIALGLMLAKFKIFGISLGVTFVLFIGILLGHFGLSVNEHVLHFFKEFGLILFVFSVGMQVGPSFFSSIKQGGLTLNLLATGIVFTGVITTLIIHFITGIPIPTMVGILSGAVTNTPGLGAAQQAFSEITGGASNDIATAYAVSYPLGVVGIILSIILVRIIFRIDTSKEYEKIQDEEKNLGTAKRISLVVKNPAVFNKTVKELSQYMSHREFVVSRILFHTNQQIETVSADTKLSENDKILVITTETDEETVKAFIGEEIPMDIKDWGKEGTLVNRRILVTKSNINGKTLGSLGLRKMLGINITRINRSGFDLIATPSLILQVGDRVSVVGTESAVAKAAEILGNSMKRLNEPNLIPIFVGIALGIVLGSIPLFIPGLSQPIKLGLAGGPLVISILIGAYGYKLHMVTYTTQSANLLLREVGITIFLACVGIGAGNGFIDTIVNQGGYVWIGYGFIITVVPLLIFGFIARYFCKLNYLSIMGLLSGSSTDPPALAYSNAAAGNDTPAVAYATVYPLTMFLRVLTAQLLILIFA